MRLNVVELSGPAGYTAFEVHHLDIEGLAERFDMLVISAFERDYLPTPTSLVGALRWSRGIDVAEVELSNAIDEHLGRTRLALHADHLSRTVRSEVERALA